MLGSGIGNYQQPDARRVMEKFLSEHKEIDAVLSANDSMALGVLEALKAANRTATVIGINGILPAVKQIETGGMLATVDFNMFKIGCTATRAAVRHLRKQPLPEKVMLPAEVLIVHDIPEDTTVPYAEEIAQREEELLAADLTALGWRLAHGAGWLAAVADGHRHARIDQGAGGLLGRAIAFQDRFRRGVDEALHARLLRSGAHVVIGAWRGRTCRRSRR